jgi:hypothetical protein
LYRKHQIEDRIVKLTKNQKKDVDLDALPRLGSNDPMITDKHKIGHAIRANGGKATQGQIRKYIETNFSSYTSQQVKNLVQRALYIYRCFPGEWELINRKFVVTYRVHYKKWNSDNQRRKSQKSDNKYKLEKKAEKDSEDDSEVDSEDDLDENIDAFKEELEEPKAEATPVKKPTCGAKKVEIPSKVETPVEKPTKGKRKASAEPKEESPAQKAKPVAAKKAKATPVKKALAKKAK